MVCMRDDNMICHRCCRGFAVRLSVCSCCCCLLPSSFRFCSAAGDYEAFYNTQQKKCRSEQKQSCPGETFLLQR